MYPTEQQFLTPADVAGILKVSKGVIKPGIIQDAFQNDLRSIINEAAQDLLRRDVGAAQTSLW
jgi:hypothetical protein